MLHTVSVAQNQVNGANQPKPVKFGCRLFGYMASNPYEGQDRFLRQCLTKGENPFQTQGVPSKELPAGEASFEEVADAIHHADGSGLASFGPDGRLQTVRKSANSAATDAEFQAVAEEIADQHPGVVVGHLRQGPQPRLENSHPFLTEPPSLLLTHNGLLPVVTKRALRHKLDMAEQRFGIPQLRTKVIRPKGNTDSELVYDYLLVRLQQEGLLVPRRGRLDTSRIKTADLERVFRQVVSEVRSISAPHENKSTSMTLPNGNEVRFKLPVGLNFMISDGRRLLATCQGRTLYKGTHRGPNGEEEVLLATRPMQPTAESGQTPIRWSRIPNGSLIVMERKDDGVTCRIKQF